MDFLKICVRLLSGYNRNMNNILNKINTDYDVDCESGAVVYKTTGNSVWSKESSGYHIITVYVSRKEKRNFRIHQLVWYKAHGYIPKMIDHIDGNKSNNRIDNLREVSRSQNMCNRKVQRNNVVGYKGVYKRRDQKRLKSYMARVFADGAVKFCKSYATAYEAAFAYDDAAIKYHGNYANINFPFLGEGI